LVTLAAFLKHFISHAKIFFYVDLSVTKFDIDNTMLVEKCFVLIVLCICLSIINFTDCSL
jgi:hypothetical protein